LNYYTGVRARHIARRSEGGFSISPAGLAVNGYQANRFSSDDDVIDSVSDDLVRRLMASLPDGKVDTEKWISR
jgi:hypothetical protein